MGRAHETEQTNHVHEKVQGFLDEGKRRLPAGEEPYLFADAVLTEGDPADVLTKSEKAKHALEDFRADYRAARELAPSLVEPRVLTMPGGEKVPYLLVLDALHEKAYAALGAKDAKRTVVRVESTVDDVLKLAAEANSRAHTAVNGKNPAAELSKKLRAAIFGQRPRPSSVDGWKTELALVKANVLGLADAPEELADLVPILDAALEALAKVQYSQGRPPKSSVQYSRNALAHVLAVDSALDKLLRSASTRATSAELARLTAIITPKRRSDVAATNADGNNKQDPNQEPPQTTSSESSTTGGATGASAPEQAVSGATTMTESAAAEANPAAPATAAKGAPSKTAKAKGSATAARSARRKK